MYNQWSFGSNCQVWWEPLISTWGIYGPQIIQRSKSGFLIFLHVRRLIPTPGDSDVSEAKFSYGAFQIHARSSLNYWKDSQTGSCPRGYDIILYGLGTCDKPNLSILSRDRSSPGAADILKFCIMALRKRYNSIFAKDSPRQLRLPVKKGRIWGKMITLSSFSAIFPKGDTFHVFLLAIL